MSNENVDLLSFAQNLDTTQLTDFTEVIVGGGARGLLPSGTAFVRLSGYVEYGMHPQSFNGQKKDPQRIFQLFFTVVGGVGVNLKGEDENFVGSDGFLPVIKTFETAQQQFQKSSAIALFRAVNVAPSNATHFIQKLGQLYTLQIGVKKHAKTGKDVQDIDFKQLQPAINPTSRKPFKDYCDKDDNVVQIPELKPEDVKVFLWDRPESVSPEQYKAMWDSIYIAGEWDEKKNDKGEVIMPKRSKNFMQEKCMSALDFDDSCLQQMIGGVRLASITASATDLPEPENTAEDVPSVEEPAKPTDIAVPDDED